MEEYFDIASYMGHKAIEELKKCYDIYDLPIAKTLESNNIIIQFDGSEIYDITKSKSVSDLDISNLDPLSCKYLSDCLKALRKKEIEICLNSVIFFQISLETLINDFKPKWHKKSFYDKWISLFNENNTNENQREYFNYYYERIYKEIRIPAVHPKSRLGLRNVDLLRFEQTREGIKKGWFCFVFLLNANGYKLNFEENWQYLSFIHNIPADPDKKIIKLDQLASSLSIKALEGLGSLKLNSRLNRD